ncbi:unnamed protein product, partial [Brassica rapa subsp. narinosa]
WISLLNITSPISPPLNILEYLFSRGSTCEFYYALIYLLIFSFLITSTLILPLNPLIT